MHKRILEALAAAAGAVASFFCGLPPIIWILLAVITLDYVTGIICGVMGKSPKTENGGLSSKEAFQGLLRKALILFVVLLVLLHLDICLITRLLRAWKRRVNSSSSFLRITQRSWRFVAQDYFLRWSWASRSISTA